MSEIDRSSPVRHSGVRHSGVRHSGIWHSGVWHSAASISASSAALDQFELQRFEEQRSRRLLARCLVAAVVLHGGLFFLPLGETKAVADELPKRLVHVYEVEPFLPVRPPIEPPAPSQPRARQPEIVVPGPVLEPELRETEVEEWIPGPVDLPLELPSAPPPPPRGSAEPIPVSGDVVAPVKKSGPDPVYPDLALHARRGGIVVLSAVIDTEGRLKELTLLEDPGLGMGDAALDAVRQWVFEPARLAERPVAVVYTLTVRFEVR